MGGLGFAEYGLPGGMQWLKLAFIQRFLFERDIYGTDEKKLKTTADQAKITWKVVHFKVEGGGVLK